MEAGAAMKYELKPCPFCGSTTAQTIMTRDEAAWSCDPGDYDGEIPMVVCCAAKKGGCGASTGFCNDDEEDFGRQAAEAWNKRAELVQHAQWEWFEEWSPSTPDGPAEVDDCGWRCSHCKTALEDCTSGYYSEYENKPNLKFCPKCGAYMDIEEK